MTPNQPIRTPLCSLRLDYLAGCKKSGISALRLRGANTDCRIRDSLLIG